MSVSVTRFVFFTFSSGRVCSLAICFYARAECSYSRNLFRTLPRPCLPYWRIAGIFSLRLSHWPGQMSAPTPFPTFYRHYLSKRVRRPYPSNRRCGRIVFLSSICRRLCLTRCSRRIFGSRRSYENVRTCLPFIRGPDDFC